MKTTDLQPPVLSPRFDVEDIRKLREYNSLRHWNMTTEELMAEYAEASEQFHKEMEEFRRQKAAAQATTA